MRLNVAEWVPAFEHEGRWHVVPSNGTAADAVESKVPDEPLLLPAGRYDVYWIQGYQQEDDPMLLASGVAVETGDETVVAASSGIHLDQADTINPTQGLIDGIHAASTGDAFEG